MLVHLQLAGGGSPTHSTNLMLNGPLNHLPLDAEQLHHEVGCSTHGSADHEGQNVTSTHQ